MASARRRGLGVAALSFLLLVLPSAAQGQEAFNKFIRLPANVTPPKNFTFPDLRGKPVQLREFRGKVVLLSFFATWCPLCAVEMPRLETLYRTYRERGFVVLAVSIEPNSPADLRRWIEERGISYPVLHDARFTTRLSHNVRWVPTLYLLDRAGQLVAWGVGSIGWEKREVKGFLEELLARAPAS